MTIRLLVLTPRFPYPLYGGDLLRIYRLCETLSKHFQITLLSVCQSQAELSIELPASSPFTEVHRVYLPKWRSYLNVLKALLTGQSMQTAYYASNAFRCAVLDLREHHEILLCHLARTAPYANEFTGTKILELTDFIPLTYKRSNALTGKGLSIRRLIYTLEQNRIDNAQNKLAKQFDLISFVSDIDRTLFLKSSGIKESRAVTFGNGISLAERPFVANREGKTVGFIGNLKAIPNADAVAYFSSQVLPLIHHVDPEVKLRVIGAVEEKFRLRYESSHIEFTGPAQDLADAMAGCVVGVCPVRMGAGIQNKMLEYMALGLAAVTTTIGAEGLEDCNGAFMIANDAPEMAKIILGLLADTTRRRLIAEKARSIVETRYSWESQLEALPQRILSAVRSEPCSTDKFSQP